MEPLNQFSPLNTRGVMWTLATDIGIYTGFGVETGTVNLPWVYRESTTIGPSKTLEDLLKPWIERETSVNLWEPFSNHKM